MKGVNQKVHGCPPRCLRALSWGHRSAIIARSSVLMAERRVRLRFRTRGRVFGWIRRSPLVPWFELAQPDCVHVFPSSRVSTWDQTGYAGVSGEDGKAPILHRKALYSCRK